MPEIKPIETYYNGYKFRSRLEARWAVFFDALKVKYEYEPEGYKLPSGSYYLPDFKVKCYGTRGELHNTPFDLYIEVKGEMTQDDALKIREFANLTYPDWNEIKDLPEIEREIIYQEAFKKANKVLIVGSIPPRGCSYDASEVGAYDLMNGIGIYPFNYDLIDGDYFAAYPAACNGKFFLWGDDSNYIWNVDEVEAAYDAARQARFEHGERPITERNYRR